jgi:hypothetical protein
MLTILEQDRYERRAHTLIDEMSHFGQSQPERRKQPRRQLLTRGQLHVHGRDIVIYTRDATERGDGVGFVAAGELHASTRVYAEVPGPLGEIFNVPGEIVRARPIAAGWYEGYVRFDHPVELFCDTPIRAA